jgi:hypothetical protein
MLLTLHGSFADEQLSGYGVVAHPGDFTVSGIEDVRRRHDQRHGC